MMNIGIRLHDTKVGTLRQRLAYAREQGFSCAHLAMSKAVDGFSMADAPSLLTDELALDVRAAFAEQQMDCAVLGCYLNLTDPDEESYQRTRKIYKAHFRFAPLMGAAVVGSETAPAKGCIFADPAPVSEEAFQLFLRRLAPMVRDAEEAGAIFAIEPVFCHIVSTPERAERMLDAAKSDSLRIILDAVNLLGPDTANDADAIIADAIRRLDGKISVLHMKDYLPIQQGDQRLESVACGLGCMQYEALLSYGRKRDLPMTLENTVPNNAEKARLYLENIAAKL